jgi:hypothetical protein
MRDPTKAAHVLGKLLVAVGPDRILWGTDSLWYGSPQDQIQAFRAFEIAPELQEEFGYPALRDKDKKRIFGLNAAKLYGVKKKVRKHLCEIPEGAVGSASGAFVSPDDRLVALQQAAGGPYATRRLHVYGPQTRRDFIKRFGWTYG